MSFTITITEVADKDLGKVIAGMQLPKGAQYHLQHTADKIQEPSNVENGKPQRKASTREYRRALPLSKLTMTGKKPTKSGVKIRKGLKLFEKLEVDRGIGLVSVNDLREYLKEEKADQGLINRLLHEGYLAYL